MHMPHDADPLLVYQHMADFVHGDAGGILNGLPVIAADAALLRGLQESGPTAWCVRDTDPQALAKALQQLHMWRALPPRTITQIKTCYDFLKVNLLKSSALTMQRRLIEAIDMTMAAALTVKALAGLPMYGLHICPASCVAMRVCCSESVNGIH